MIAKTQRFKKKESVFNDFTTKILLHLEVCFIFAPDKQRILSFFYSKHRNQNKKKGINMETLVIKELTAGEEISLLYNICIIW